MYGQHSQLQQRQKENWDAVNPIGRSPSSYVHANKRHIWHTTAAAAAGQNVAANGMAAAANVFTEEAVNAAACCVV